MWRCMALQPVPPYCRGQPGAIQPFLANILCQRTASSRFRWRRARTLSLSSLGRFSRKNACTSARKRRSSSLYSRSIAAPLEKKMGAAFPAAGVPASRQAWNAGVRASGLRSLNLRPLATSSSSNFAGFDCGPRPAPKRRPPGRPWGRAEPLAVVHGPAAVHGPAVAVDPHHVDVGGTHGHALLQDLGALVDHGIDAALQDLVV